MRYLKILLFISSILFFSSTLSAEIMDYAAGYSDGCKSAKGDFSRSSFGYKNIATYKEGWLKGKEECKLKHKASKSKKSRRKKHYHKRRVKKHYVKKRRKRRVKRVKRARYVTRAKPKYSYQCKSNPWLTFSQGWDDGYRSARGVWTRSENSCPEYERGWQEGFNQCKCQELGECVTLSSSYP